MSQDSKPSFSNPNLNFHLKQEDQPGKTGIHSVDASNDLYKKIENAQIEGMIDTLTGCFNRNYFERFKEKNFDPNREDNEIALVFADLNDVKKINDAQGHIAGDTLIKDAANYFKSSFRKDDIIIRLGGDEFVIICRNYKKDPDFETRLANKISERRDKNNCPSFAFGVAAYNQKRDQNNIENTVKLADQRMYEDKSIIKAKK